ncbi:helix-turn-helix domain-containing protein [Undibacterium arcticum]|uniref:Helix-turn-helix domain-containing protein n=1 Tax=Undibacterium arcticum TaxID=1762892 RepID=A0ABV7F3C8_9BURK
MLLTSDSQPKAEVQAAPLRNGAHQIRTVEAHDADDHARNLTAWEQSYDQITPGQFHGMLAELQMPQMQVFLEQTSQAVRQSCCVWPDAFWFGLQGHADSGRVNGRINGRLGDAGAIMVRPGNCEFELVTPVDYAIYGIVIQRNALLCVADQMGCRIDWLRLASAEVLHVTEPAKTACLQTLAYLLSEDDVCSERNPVASLELPQQAVMMAMLSMLDTSEVDRAVSNSFMRRQRIVAQARDYVLAHRDQVITVPELCERLHVSRRTLQYCFEDVLGISPIQYLRIIRLNGARRHLREGLSGSLTVRDVAADWGFWHFSQFSSDYRKLFGQSPSESLRQRTH